MHQLLICLNCLRDVTSRISLDEHELEDVDLLIIDPGLIKLIEVLGHVLHDALHRDIDCVFDDALVEVADHVLNDPELLEKLASGVQHFMREYILLAVDPEVGEALLRRVKNLRQVA